MTAIRRSSVPHASPPRKAWITLLTRADYLPTTIALYRTLRSVSAYPLVILATPSLPAWAREILLGLGLSIVDVEPLLPSPDRHPGFEAQFARFQDTWSKLRVFGLTQYERLIMIDSDMVFLRTMDELFDVELPGQDWIGAAPACVCNPLKIDHYPSDWVPSNCSLSKQKSPTEVKSVPIPALDGPRTSHLLNSGLLILHPSSQSMEEIIQYLDTSPDVATHQFPDQDLLAAVFHGRWRPLPWWANALKTARAVHSDLWEDTEVRLIHYILDKPWNRPRPQISKTTALLSTQSNPSPNARFGQPLPSTLVALSKNTAPQTSVKDYEGVHLWWWAAYDDALEELKGSGFKWEKVDELVTH